MAIKTFYRGVRMFDHELKTLSSEGMRYYWKDPEESIRSIFRALEENHKISKLGIEPSLRNLVAEASRNDRIQIWCTDDKKNANSYARWTPELIFLTLDFVRIDRKEIQKYLNKTFGDPYVIEFNLDIPHPEAYYNNHTIGKFIPSMYIEDVQKVDLDSVDPLSQSLAIM